VRPPTCTPDDESFSPHWSTVSDRNRCNALVALGYSFVFRTQVRSTSRRDSWHVGSLFAYTLYQKQGLPAALAVVLVFIIVGAMEA